MLRCVVLIEMCQQYRAQYNNQLVPWLWNRMPLPTDPIGTGALGSVDLKDNFGNNTWTFVLNRCLLLLLCCVLPASAHQLAPAPHSSMRSCLRLPMPTPWPFPLFPSLAPHPLS
jgi:hypothetical protein